MATGKFKRRMHRRGGRKRKGGHARVKKLKTGGTIVHAKVRDVVSYVHRGMPFPDHYICKLNSVLEGNFIGSEYSATGAASFYVNANQLTLPWVAGGAPTFPTHSATATAGLSPYNGYTVASLEPQGLGQLLTRSPGVGIETRGIYQSYRVIASTIRVFLSNQSVTNDVWLTIVPFVVNALYVPINQAGAAADQFAKTCRGSYINSRTRPLSNSISMPKIFGRTQAQYMDDEAYAGTGTTSPTLQANWGVYIQEMDGLPPAAGTDLGCTLKCEVEWVVEFYNALSAALDTL